MNSFGVLILILAPIIGCIPYLDTVSENSNAPNRLLVSVTAIAGILFSEQRSAIFSIVNAPSDNE